MQPYFFPYIGYLSLIAASDKFILFDTAQYIRHGWVNRNRILKPSKDDWQYITAPLEKHQRETPISEIYVRQDGWERKMLAQLQHYRKRSKYYAETIRIVEETLMSDYPDARITHRIAKSLELICQYIELPLNLSVFTEMDLQIAPAAEPDEWALNICKAMGATGYVNPEGGLDFFDVKKYEDADVAINFIRNNLTAYPQSNNQFIPGLSIIDVLMNNNPEQMHELVSNYSVVDKSRTLC